MAHSTPISERIAALEDEARRVFQRSVELIEERRCVAMERSGLRARRHEIMAGMASARISAEVLRAEVEQSIIANTDEVTARATAIEIEHRSLATELDKLDTRDAFLWSQSQTIQNDHRALQRDESRVECELLVAYGTRAAMSVSTSAQASESTGAEGPDAGSDDQEEFVDLFEGEGFDDDADRFSDSGTLTLAMD